MKKHIGITAAVAAVLCFSASAAYSKALSVTMEDANPQAAKRAIGVVTITEGLKGKPLTFKVDLASLPVGAHGFHIHQHPSCADAAMEAGGHWDPAGTDRHAGPLGDGHRGDLPSITVGADGRVKTEVYAPRLTKLDEVRGHALMIHEGADNYSDYPQPLGGGGKRLACGVIPSATR